MTGPAFITAGASGWSFSGTGGGAGEARGRSLWRGGRGLLSLLLLLLLLLLLMLLLLMLLTALSSATRSSPCLPRPWAVSWAAVLTWRWGWRVQHVNETRCHLMVLCVEGSRCYVNDSIVC